MRNPFIRSVVAALVVLALTVLGLGSATAAAPGTRTGLQGFDVNTSLASSWAEQNLARANDAGFTCHRIPALTTANNGWLLASWDGRPGTCADAPQPNSIVQRISKDNGATWGDVTVIAQGNPDPGKRGFSDPSYVVDRQTGRIFNFFVMSLDAGWPQRNDVIGSNERMVMHAVYYYSDDHGQTWAGPVTVTDALNPAPANTVWTGRFAASGEGIQIKHGVHAGRLVQQYTIYEKATGRYLAVSLFSDDHGATWRAGQPIGPGMDENKVVELSDGRLMLNSRKSDGTGGRYVAYSTDGGQTWGNRRTDTTLIDPQNNASIIRAFPNAAPGTAKAKILLFSNSAASSRSNGTIRVSYDDGASWSDSKVFAPGAMAYSTMSVLANGAIAILFEGTSSTINVGTFTWAWVGGLGAAVAPGEVVLHRGANEVPVTLSSALGADLPAGQLTITGPNQITATPTAVPAIPAGQSATVRVPVRVPDSYDAAPVVLQASYAVGGKTATAPIPTRVELRSGETPGANKLNVVLTLKSATKDFYRAGDKVSWWVRVSNLAGSTINAVPRAGDWTNLSPTCRWNNLVAQPSGNYNCGQSGSTGNNPPTLTLTQADINRGYIVPTQVWAVSLGSDVTAASPLQELTFTGERLDLPSVTVTNAGPVSVPDVIVAGTKLTYRFDYASRTAMATTITPSVGEFGGFLPGSTPNCVASDLAGGASSSCATAVYTVTADDVSRGYAQPSSVFVVSRDAAGTQPLATLSVPAPKTPIVTPPAPTPTTTPAQPVLRVDPGTISIGESFRVIGSGLTPAEVVRVELHSTVVVLGEAKVASDGKLSATFRLPDVPAGLHDIVVVLADGRKISTPVKIVAAKLLPATGAARIDAAVLLGLTMTAAVGILARRRSHA